MALNTKTFATRTLSAIVFGILLIGSVYWNYYSFSIFFFVVALTGLHEFYKIAEKLGAKPFKITGFICGSIIYMRFINFSDVDPFVLSIIQKCLNSFMIIMPLILFARALFSKKEHSIKDTLFTIGAILYVVLPFGLLNQSAFLNNESWQTSDYDPKLILGIIFLIWSNDTFAYIGGSIFGKHKMIERVSPGKTWEGTIIGVLLTFALSFIFEHFCKLNIPWAVFGITVPILATIGDLVESKLKRESGIKDSGKIMPGHGGVLDRFDSLIFVAPFVFAILYFIS